MKKTTIFERGEDYTDLIIECVKYIVAQTRKKFWTLKEVYYQAESAYGWYITGEAFKAIKRNINNNQR